MFTQDELDIAGGVSVRVFATMDMWMERTFCRMASGRWPPGPFKTLAMELVALKVDLIVAILRRRCRPRRTRRAQFHRHGFGWRSSGDGLCGEPWRTRAATSLA